MEFTMNFEGIQNNLCPVRSLSPEEGHYFFGYYDLMPYSPDGRRHLAGKLPFDGALNGKDDVMEFGWLEDGRFYKLFETKAWNFQQGILGQYQYDGQRNVLFYNTLDEEAGCYRTVRHDLDTGVKTVFPMASGHISHDGRYGLAINFSRIWDFRPGYGYPNLPDPFADIPHPRGDGIFLIDFKTGAVRQLMDCKALYEAFPLAGRQNAKMVVNHVTFNPSADRYIFLYRSFPEKDNPATGKTALFSGDLDGNLNLLFDEMVSHYWWENDRSLISFSRTAPDAITAVLRTDVQSGRSEVIGGEEGPLVGLLGRWGDIHCSLSPDGRYMIGDMYPDAEGYRKIIIYEFATNRVRTLLDAYSPYPEALYENASVDARCDLHARWNRDGTRISFDALCRGRREIMEIDMTDFSF